MFKNLWARAKARPWLSAIIVLLILAAIFIGGRAISGRRGAAAQAGDFQVEVITRGNLVAAIGATGIVRANQSANLIWKSSGIVESVAVKVGDSVLANAQLAQLVTSSLPQNVILAQNELKQAQDNLDAFHDSYGDLGIAQAERDLAEAQDALADAERDFSYVSTIAQQVDIDQALSNLVLSENQLDRAKDNYEPFANKPEDNLVRANLLGKLATAQSAYNSALRIYNIFTTPGTSLEISLAQADLDLARLHLEEVQENYSNVLAGPNAMDVAAAEAQVTAANATLSQANITVPFAGIVTDTHAKIGDLVSAGQLAFRLDDLSQMLIDVDVSEVDINRVALGQKAVITFDAAPEKEFQGEVIEIAMAGTSSQGAVNFRVTVELNNADESVLPGMTAGVNIIVTELDNVLLVQNRAVRIQDGKRVIYILGEERLEQIEISLGASSESFSVLLNEELEGARIVLNPPSNFFDGDGGPPAIFGGRGGGGGGFGR